MNYEIKVHDPAPTWDYPEKLDYVLEKIEKNTIWEIEGYTSIDSTKYFSHMIQNALAIKEWRTRQEREFALYKKLRAKFSPS